VIGLEQRGRASYSYPTVTTTTDLAARTLNSDRAAFSSAMPFTTYLGHWLSHIRARVRLSTYEGYRTLLQCHVIPALGEIELGRLHPLDLQTLYSALLGPERKPRPLSAGSVRNLHLVLAQALKQAVSWQLIDRSPASGAQPPRPRPHQYTVADPALLRMLLHQLVGHPLELPAAFAIATGMRRGELLALRWSDLAPDHSVAYIRRSLQITRQGLRFEEPKTRRSRRAIILPALIHPYLERQEAVQQSRHSRSSTAPRDALIIDSGDGQPINPDSLSSAWRRFIRGNELPAIRFHDLRHSHATALLLQGVHPKIVSERLGHASIGITLDTYSHVLPTMQSDAVTAFDELFAQTQSN
jgi:integrase